MWLALGVVSVPSKLFKFLVVMSERKVGRTSSPCRVLPFCLRQQPIILASYSLQPGHIPLGISPTDIDYGLLPSSPFRVVDDPGAITEGGANIPLRKRKFECCNCKGATDRD